MHVILTFFLLVPLVAGFFSVYEPPENELNIVMSGADTTLSGTGNEYVMRQGLTPLSVYKDKNIIKQMYDFSCGSGALATLLKYDMGEFLGERQVINGLIKYGDREKIVERKGFSLLDMKRYVHTLGYEAEGYKAEISDLIEFNKPCIVPITLRNNYHFVVLRGVYGDHIFIADPSQGNLSFTINRFKKIWHKNILFIVFPKGGKGLGRLALSEEDLRFIDSDTLRNSIFSNVPPLVPFEQSFTDALDKTLNFKGN